MADQTASENWQRYEYGRTRGHRDYCAQARRCERFFLGGGEQWDEADLAILKAQGRPAYEFNEVMPSVNSAVGYQIHNRMDIAFKPRGGKADQLQAEIRSKVAMQIADMNKLHWLETQVFGDGMIQQRGFYDVRMDFTENMQGDAKITTLDPLDVVPDPDAKSYDPDDWGDVIVTRWLTYDDIEQQFGKEKRTEVENFNPDHADFGDDGEGEPHNKFGNSNSGAAYDAQYSEAQLRRVRVIDRQRWVCSLTKVGVWPETGDVRVIEDETPERLAELQAEGVIITKRMQKRVKWTVSTHDITLHDDWSPYKHFSIVPYFAYFRRGKTRGMVDNAIGPQEALNKAVSQFVHIINTSANSGWVVEENSLTNMETDDLETVGAKTGLTLEYKHGSTKPEKIQPNAVPTGVDRLIDRATNALKDVTIPEAMRGVNGPEVSGIAIQSKQFASQQQLATPLDNLAHTRHLLAGRLHDLMQQFYTAARIFRITETDPMTGKPQTKEIAINQFDPATGVYQNDMTEGEYDVVVTEQPMAATFEDSQFQQALELRKAGVAIPDDAVIRHSNLTDKQDILSRMDGQKQADPLAEAKAALLAAQTKKVEADTVQSQVETQFSAMQAAQVVATVPGVAPVADSMLQSAGFRPDPNGIDPNIPDIARPTQAVPAVNQAAPGVPSSTTLYPLPMPKTATPGMGERHGIETMRPDSAPGFANGGLLGDDEIDPETGLTKTQSIGISTSSAPAVSAPRKQQSDPNPGYSANPAPASMGNTVSDFAGTGNVISEFAGRIDPFNTFKPDDRDGYADGGHIIGPGTGTSDSIPAVVDEQEPIKVSAGEYVVPADVVAALGKEFFDDLLRALHKPVAQDGAEG